MTHVHHALDYLELTSPAPGATREFLGRAFGWGFTSYGPEYTGIHDPAGPSREAGGIAHGEPRAPLPILWSDDLDASYAAVVEAGGVITVEPFDFPGGRRFQFTEPGGTELAVWSAPGNTA